MAKTSLPNNFSNNNSIYPPLPQFAELIPGFNGYAVDRNGVIYGCRAGRRVGGVLNHWRQLKTRISRTGYEQIGLMLNCGKSRQYLSVHVLVLLTFDRDRRTEGLQVRHRNGIRHDNRLTNLEWGTAKDNADDRTRHGNTLVGSIHHQAKLTEAEVLKIRQMSISRKAIAAQFNVTQATIGYIINRKTWRHI